MCGGEGGGGDPSNHIFRGGGVQDQRTLPWGIMSYWVLYCLSPVQKKKKKKKKKK